jgi:hypothetical protein
MGFMYRFVLDWAGYLAGSINGRRVPAIVLAIALAPHSIILAALACEKQQIQLVVIDVK